MCIRDRVYLNESNTFYHYLRRIGVKVFSIDSDLNETNTKVFTNLDETDAMHNRRRMIDAFSEATVVSTLRESLNKFLLAN